MRRLLISGLGVPRRDPEGLLDEGAQKVGGK